MVHVGVTQAGRATKPSRRRPVVPCSFTCDLVADVVAGEATRKSNRSAWAMSMRHAPPLRQRPRSPPIWMKGGRRPRRPVGRAARVASDSVVRPGRWRHAEPRRSVVFGVPVARTAARRWDRHGARRAPAAGASLASCGRRCVECCCGTPMRCTSVRARQPMPARCAARVRDPRLGPWIVQPRS